MPTQWCFPLAVLPFLRPNVSLSALNKHFSHSGRPQIAVQGIHLFARWLMCSRSPQHLLQVVCFYFCCLVCTKREKDHILQQVAAEGFFHYCCWMLARVSHFPLVCSQSAKWRFYCARRSALRQSGMRHSLPASVEQQWTLHIRSSFRL